MSYKATCQEQAIQWDNYLFLKVEMLTLLLSYGLLQHTANVPVKWIFRSHYVVLIR